LKFYVDETITSTITNYEHEASEPIECNEPYESLSATCYRPFFRISSIFSLFVLLL